jgi:hypothetical protein
LKPTVENGVKSLMALVQNVTNSTIGQESLGSVDDERLMSLHVDFENVKVGGRKEGIERSTGYTDSLRRLRREGSCTAVFLERGVPHQRSGSSVMAQCEWKWINVGVTTLSQVVYIPG